MTSSKIKDGGILMTGPKERLNLTKIYEDPDKVKLNKDIL